LKDNDEIQIIRGDLRDPGFRERRAAYPKAARTAQIFQARNRHSSYGRCGDCAYWHDCVLCPIVIGYDALNTDPNRVPDFICAFNRVASKYRELFPCMPDPLEGMNAVLKKLEGDRIPGRIQRQAAEAKPVSHGRVSPLK
jgi:hypothetical protein